MRATLIAAYNTRDKQKSPKFYVALDELKSSIAELKKLYENNLSHNSTLSRNIKFDKFIGDIGNLLLDVIDKEI
jgi:hypothetical protein